MDEEPITEIRRGGGVGVPAPFEEMDRRFGRMLEAFAPGGLFLLMSLVR